MRQHINYILLLLWLYLGISYQHATVKEKPGINEKQIVLIHSYKEETQDYSIFEKKLKETFFQRGINFRLHTFFLDSRAFFAKAEEARMYHYIDSIQHINPDIILVNDDQATYSLMKCRHPFVKKIPIVFAGVNYPNEELLAEYPNITGFEDKPDFVENIKFISELFGKLSINISYDQTTLGKKAFQAFLTQVEPRNDIDFNTKSMELVKLNMLEEDSVFIEQVELLKERQNQRKIKEERSIAIINIIPYCMLPGSDILFQMSGVKGNTTYLDIKYDYTSDVLGHITTYPSFASEYEPVYYSHGRNSKYIGGYFCTMEIQAREQACMAASILKGARVKDLPIRESKKEHVLVWHAIKTSGLDLKKIPPYVRLINVPFHEYHKKEIMILLIVLFLLVSFLAIRFKKLFSRELKFKQTAQEKLEKKNQELRLAVQKAQESDRMKSAFLANMSHEIRTPLNAIIGFSNILNSDVDITPSEREEFLSLISSNNELLLNLINDILDLSRIESGKMAFNFESYLLNDILTKVYHSYKIRMPKGVELYIDIPNQPLEIYTDVNRLTQVLNNLLNNAIKFTTKGSITIGCNYFCNQRRVELYIEDTGKGIALEKQDKIFNRFIKLDEFVQGTGLGLAICKIIVERLDGFIGVKSTINKGSRFYVNVPLKPKPKESKI